MSEQGSSPEDIRARTARLKETIEARERGLAPESGKSQGLRIATDIIVCIAVGLFLGYWADRWLASNPWGIMLGLGFGMAAGVRTAIRASEAQDKTGKNSGPQT